MQNRLPIQMILTLWLVAVALPAVAQLRTWRDFTGDEIQAVFVEGDDKAIMVRMADGRSLRIPMSTLSAADREYAQSLVDASKPQFPVSGTVTWTVPEGMEVEVEQQGTITLYEYNPDLKEVGRQLGSFPYHLRTVSDDGARVYDARYTSPPMRVTPGKPLLVRFTLAFRDGEGQAGELAREAYSAGLKRQGGGLWAGNASFTVKATDLANAGLTTAGTTGSTRTDWVVPTPPGTDAPAGLPGQLLPPGAAGDARVKPETARESVSEGALGETIQDEPPPPGLPQAWR